SQGNSEHALVARIRDWSQSREIGDDCAVLPAQLLVSTDTLVESVHFKLEATSLFDLGTKAIAVNLSDIAAMAGRPRHALVSVTWPDYLPVSDLEELYKGMLDCLRTYRSRLVGGDFSKGPCLSITVTVLGTTHEDGCLRRSGANPGDVVVVTGDFGASRGGLELILRPEQFTNDSPYCRRRHLTPVPRLCEAWALVRKTAGSGAMMDASDGLADALFQIARDSQVGMRVELEKVPLHNETEDLARHVDQDPLDWALYGGEDYELVACLSKEIWREWSLADSDCPFVEIGETFAGSGVELYLAGRDYGMLDLKRTFQHFS
ncbi:MAG: thiamine-phosphate kinase, partial [Candidatus Obscuribacterales bacterium]|nr:thiamine-phosphate kinase [Candidatus Obscuribacterales bacterium]